MVPDKKKLRFRGAGSAAASAGFNEWPGAYSVLWIWIDFILRRFSFTKAKANSSTTCVH